MNILLCEKISATNQYIELLAQAYQNLGHHVIFGVENFLYSDFIPDILHLQWPEAIYRWGYQLPSNKETINLFNKRLTYYSKAKVPIVYTVHNRLPHENVAEFDKEVYNLISRFADIIVHHGSASISLMKHDFPECSEAQHIICPHGPYPYIFDDAYKARNFYNLPHSKYVFLNFGHQKQYKGTDFITKVFNTWSEQKALLFTIGPKSAKITENKSFMYKAFRHLVQEVDLHLAEARSRLYRNKKIVLRPVANNEIPKIIAAIDAFFLGHRDGLNSGLLNLAASYGKPVVFPDLGNFEEQLIDWPWKESYKAGNVNSAIGALNRMYSRIDEHSPGSVMFDNNRWLASNSWNKHVHNIINEVKTFRHSKY